MLVSDLRRRIRKGLIIGMTQPKAKNYSIQHDDKTLDNNDDLMALCPEKNGDIILCMITNESFQLGITVQSSIS